jgi:hypothetical protein
VSGQDRARLERARRVVTGGAEPSSWNTAGYAVYVAVLFAVAWGLPLGQDLVRTVDPSRLVAQVSPVGVVALGVVAAVLLAGLAWRTGSVRGPVVPELPYVDHIVASPLGRDTVTRSWWRLSLLGCVVAGLLVGAVVTTSLLANGVGTLAQVPAGSAAGALLGWLVAHAWLRGQLAARRLTAGVPPALQGGLLGRLSAPVMRRQAAGSATMGGAVLVGDLRAVRLEVAPPTSRGRGIHLRAAGRLTVVLRRDLLGLRRDRWRAARGMALAAAGSVVVLAGAGATATPWLLLLAASVALQAGYRTLTEGLRLQADSCGTPALLGLEPRAQALTHLVVPSALYAVSVAAAAAVCSPLWGVRLVAVWPLALVGILAGLALGTAFRGLAPGAVFSPRMGMPALLAWAAAPSLTVLLALVVITGLAWPALLGTVPGDPAGPAAAYAAATAGFLAWGLHRQRALTEAHRT